MKRAVNFLVLSAISMAVLGQAEPAKADRRDGEQREVIQSEEEHRLIMQTLRQRILQTSYSNCSVENGDYVTLINGAGRWLGIYFGSMGASRIWRREIGSQPVLEIETHLDNHQPTRLQSDPSEILRTLIFTNRSDSRVMEVLVSREQGYQIDVGTVSRPKLVKKFSVVEAINCMAKN